MQIRKEMREGRVNWKAQETAADGKVQCLCTNGCARFKNNVRNKEAMESVLGPSALGLMYEKYVNFIWMLLAISKEEQNEYFINLSPKSPCPLADAHFFESPLIREPAEKITECPWFIPDETVTILHRYRYTCDINDGNVNAAGERPGYLEEFDATDIGAAHIRAQMFIRKYLEAKCLSPMNEKIIPVNPEEPGA